jgi:hypothetical protein
MKRIPIRFLAAAALLAWAASPSPAYVEAIMPLAQVLNESTVIVEGTVEMHDATKKIATIRTGKSLKGKCTYDLIRITYGGGQFWHPEAIPKHLVKGAPAVMFYNDARQSQCYLNRFFFQLYGDPNAPPDKAWWSMTHIEIRMNRTYNGTAPALSELVTKVLAGKEKPPAPVAKIPPMELHHVKSLPAHGEPLDESKLPIPFRTYDPNAKADAAPVAADGEGFLQRWITLGPIPVGNLAGDHNAALNKDWIPNQKTVKPTQHEKVTVAGQELRWEVGTSSEWVLDFGSTENSVTIAVAYVVSDADVADAALLTGSDDSAAWWLNGQEVQRFVGGRANGKDQERTAKPVALKKGVNMLVTAVINGAGPTQCCARFVDKAGQPLKVKSGAEAPKQ